MLPDGTIAIRILVVHDGMIGHGYFEVMRSDSDYDQYIDSVGGLKPGESKLVPPSLPEHCLPR